MMYRNDGRRVQVYNEGLTVYLFDEANTATVVEELDASHDEGAESKTLLGLARDGVLVMYELWQDDPIDVEVALGEPLSAAEKKPARWMKLVKVPIALPSGRLRIETGASFAHPEEYPSTVIDVPPGTYELALHRVNRAAMTTKKLAAYDGPGEVVTLTPWPGKKKFKPKDSLIHMGDARRAPWVGRYEIEDRSFTGQVVNSREERGDQPTSWAPGGERRLNINLDHAAYERLGLRRGQRLHISANGRDWVVLCQGRMIPSAARLMLGDEAYHALADLHPGLLVGFLSNSSIGGEPSPTATGQYREYDYFVISTISEESEGYAHSDDRFNELFRFETGTSIELRVMDKPFFELDEELPDDWTVEDGEVRCRVVFSNEDRLYLNAGLEALKGIGFGDGDALELRFGDERRKVFDKRYIPWRDWNALMERELKAAPASQKRRIEEIEGRVYDENGQIDPSVEGLDDLLRERHRLRYHPDDLQRPPLTLGFRESRDFQGREMIELTSALASTPHQPTEVHLELHPGDAVVLRKSG